jgi:transcriptional regulator with XRE-family HTH domain
LYNLGEAIAADRAKLGLTQDELARALGVGQQSLSKWENGISAPRNNKLYKIVGFFGDDSETCRVIKNKPEAPKATQKQDKPADQVLQLAAQVGVLTYACRQAIEFLQGNSNSDNSRIVKLLLTAVNTAWK